MVKGLSVRDVERMMAASVQANRPSAGSSQVTTADWRALEDRLRGGLGTRVRLSGTSERGKIEIEFYSSDELDGLLLKLDPPPVMSENTSNRNTAANRIPGILSNRRSH